MHNINLKVAKPFVWIFYLQYNANKNTTVSFWLFAVHFNNALRWLYNDYFDHTNNYVKMEWYVCLLDKLVKMTGPIGFKEKAYIWLPTFYAYSRFYILERDRRPSCETCFAPYCLPISLFQVKYFGNVIIFLLHGVYIFFLGFHVLLVQFKTVYTTWVAIFK